MRKKTMAVLTAKTRAKIPTKSFALPGRRFPVHDKIHARVAKSYASRMVKRGQLSAGQASQVNAAANRRLAMRIGGSVMNRTCAKCGGKMAAGGRTCSKCGGRMKLAGGGMGDSGRTKPFKRMKLATGGVVAAQEYAGERGQSRLRGNADYGRFARFDGDGG
jgi:hypothetical protein